MAPSAPFRSSCADALRDRSPPSSTPPASYDHRWSPSPRPRPGASGGLGKSSLLWRIACLVVAVVRPAGSAAEVGWGWRVVDDSRACPQGVAGVEVAAGADHHPRPFKDLHVLRAGWTQERGT
eukprot:842217-Rhodomonas_salina.1